MPTVVAYYNFLVTFVLSADSENAKRCPKAEPHQWGFLPNFNILVNPSNDGPTLLLWRFDIRCQW